MDNIEISLGKFRLEIFLVYISSGGQRWGGVGAKLGQSYCPQRMNSLLSGSERANDPALWEAEGDDDEDKVEDHHDATHRLRHLPLEGDDGDEDEEQHDEEHPDRATDADAVHLKQQISTRPLKVITLSQDQVYNGRPFNWVCGKKVIGLSYLFLQELQDFFCWPKILKLVHCLLYWHQIPPCPCQRWWCRGAREEAGPPSRRTDLTQSMKTQPCHPGQQLLPSPKTDHVCHLALLGNEDGGDKVGDGGASREEGQAHHCVAAKNFLTADISILFCHWHYSCHTSSIQLFVKIPSDTWFRVFPL